MWSRASSMLHPGISRTGKKWPATCPALFKKEVIGRSLGARKRLHLSPLRHSGLGAKFALAARIRDPPTGVGYEASGRREMGSKDRNRRLSTRVPVPNKSRGERPDLGIHRDPRRSSDRAWKKLIQEISCGSNLGISAHQLFGVVGVAIAVLKAGR